VILTTYTGRKLDLLAPDPKQIDPVDIAHALALTCRFGGHLPRHYSVAQHSIYVAQVAGIIGSTLYLEGLLHDAAEAYIGDVITPVKALCPQFHELEKRIQAAVRERFGLPETPSHRHAAAVKDADTLILAVEARELLHRSPKEYGLDISAPAHFRIEAWAPELAESRFLTELAKCTGRSNYAREALGVSPC
jgi:5'-deoxynucleotidase YfbR-like HD superfamily hydrolase